MGEIVLDIIINDGKQHFNEGLNNLLKKTLSAISTLCLQVPVLVVDRKVIDNKLIEMILSLTFWITAFVDHNDLQDIILL